MRNTNSHPTPKLIQSESIRMPCYELERLLFPPVGFLRCPLDGGALKNAVRSTVCGHAFGMKCILEHLIKHDTCPVCHASLEPTNLQPDEDRRGQIEQLKIRCPEKRCSWIGTTADEEGHHNSAGCAVQIVACPFCRGSFELGAPFDAHKEVCDDFIVICEKCLDDMPRRELRQHTPLCAGNVPEPLQRQQTNLKQSSASPVRQSSSHSIHRHHDVSAQLSPEMIVRGASPQLSPPMRSMECSGFSTLGQDTLCPPTSASCPPTAPASRQASAPSKEDEKKPTIEGSTSSGGIACPFEAFGCDVPHKTFLDPATMHHHLSLLSAKVLSLAKDNAALRISHETLHAIVDGQAKTIAHLTSRNNLLQSYVKTRAPPAANTGAARTGSTDGAKAKVEDIVRTPLSKGQGGDVPSSSRKGKPSEGGMRSASSPAAPGRPEAKKPNTDSATAVPLFRPKQPKKPAMSSVPSRRSSETAVVA